MAAEISPRSAQCTSARGGSVRSIRRSWGARAGLQAGQQATGVWACWLPTVQMIALWVGCSLGGCACVRGVLEGQQLSAGAQGRSRTISHRSCHPHTILRSCRCVGVHTDCTLPALHPTSPHYVAPLVLCAHRQRTGVHNDDKVSLTWFVYLNYPLSCPPAATCARAGAQGRCPAAAGRWRRRHCGRSSTNGARGPYSTCCATSRWALRAEKAWGIKTRRRQAHVRRHGAAVWTQVTGVAGCRAGAGTPAHLGWVENVISVRFSSSCLGCLPAGRPGRSDTHAICFKCSHSVSVMAFVN